MWKSHGMSQEIENITKSDKSFASSFVNHNLLPDANFNSHCLMKNNISIPKKVINLSICYTLTQWLTNLNTNFTLDNCSFGSIKLTKHVDSDKYKYSGYGIRFDSRSEFSLPDGNVKEMLLLLGLI